MLHALIVALGTLVLTARLPPVVLVLPIIAATGAPLELAEAD